MPVPPGRLVVGPSPTPLGTNAVDVEAAGALASAWCRSSCISGNDHGLSRTSLTVHQWVMTYQKYVSGYPKGCKISRLFESRGRAAGVLCQKCRVSAVLVALLRTHSTLFRLPLERVLFPVIVASSIEEKARDSAIGPVSTIRDVPSGDWTDIDDMLLLLIEAREP
jgi:hypothetical protein